MYSSIKEAVAFIQAHMDQAPLLGIVLGSGLGAYADKISIRACIPFKNIPHFPIATAPGHAGNIVIGKIEGVPALAMQGRLHLYEGYSAAQVAFPIRVLGSLGVSKLVLTNAAGGINMAFYPGDLMLVSDHINLTGSNPLTGPNLDVFGPRFPDMGEAYDLTMRQTALAVAKQEGISLHEGVYLGLAGPSYETPAEIKMYRALGADAVGMSMIHEVIAARHMGIPVLGISCITNMASGIMRERLTHDEVLRTAERAIERLESLFQALIPRLI